MPQLERTRRHRSGEGIGDVVGTDTVRVEKGEDEPHRKKIVELMSFEDSYIAKNTGGLSEETGGGGWSKVGRRGM